MDIISFSIIGAIAALLASLLAGISVFLAEKRRREKAPSLEDRITTLTENLKTSSSVISEIASEIEKRRQIADKLKNDVQRYEQLREISQPQVEAIAQTIRSEIRGESRKSVWRNAIITFFIALVFFFIGLFVGRI